MKRWKKIAAVAGGTVLGVGAVTAIAGSLGIRRFWHRYEDEKKVLLAEATRLPTPEGIAVNELPAPVRRYLGLIRPKSPAGMRTAVIHQRGELRTSADQPWMPFVSEQVYSLAPPGFLWHAKARVAPAIHMLARDKFVAGTGNMHITLLGLLEIANATGPTIDSGAGLRYWGEVIAFSEAILDNHLRWEPINDRSARLHIDQAPLQLSALVEFDGQGFLESVHAERYRDVNGVAVLTPWSGHMQGWKAFGERLFPTTWTSVWHLPEGDLTAVRMQIEDVTVD